MKKELQSKDLRIGNLVYDAAENIHQITSINGVDLGLLGCSIELRFAKPILLTEEWLLKLGFKKDKVDETYYNGNFQIMLPYFFQYKTSLIDHIIVKYVHQLQNIYFALTGEELELKNG